MKRFFNNEEPDENFFNLEEEYIFGDEDEEIPIRWGWAWKESI